MAIRSKKLEYHLVRKLQDINKYKTYDEMSQEMTDMGIPLSAHTIGNICRYSMGTPESEEKVKKYVNPIPEETHA